MDLLFSVIFAWVATIAVALLSIVYVLRKLGKKNRNGVLYKWNKKLRKPHKWLGIVAIAAGLLHGLYSSMPVISGNKGTVAWVLIILLGVSYMLRKKLKGKWAKSHRVMAALTCLLVIVHVLEVGGFVGIDGLALALERDGVSVGIVSEAEDHDDNETDDYDDDEDDGLFSFFDDDHDGSGGQDADPATEAVVEVVIQDTNDKIVWDGMVLDDGTYTGVADGFGPDLTTEVVVENGKVVSIEVISHNEKQERYYGEPIATIPGRIIEEESLQVDSISGATYTSYGIMMSVEDALQDAIVEGESPGVEAPASSKRKRGH